MTAPALRSAPSDTRSSRHTADWRRSYTHRLIVGDALAVAWAVVFTQLVWFGIDRDRILDGTSSVPYELISIVVGVSWMIALQYFGSRDHKVIGTESAEYKRVADASLRLFGVIGVAAFLLKVDFARGYFLTALPIGLALLFLSRWMWRQWLRRQRAAGNSSFKVLVVGHEGHVVHLATELMLHRSAGYHIMGAIVTGSTKLETLPGTELPVRTDIDRLTETMKELGADTVAITSSDDLPPGKVRSISWDLEPGRHHMIVAPSLTDIAGPRLRTRPVAGLPLIHVETPRFDGTRFVSKRLFDIVAASAMVLALLPLLLPIALLVALTSPGPVFYRQTRIGLNGEPFGMFKFRSMRPDADRLLAALLAEQGSGSTPLFKVKNDPRITPIGRVLRKYSLDELPQLFNVVLGDMSLVGPRPQVAGEVALYSSSDRRRLLLKPGMSGLWQVSGRSSLSWDDAIRLDLFYVENWSITGDLIILLKTVKAVVAPGDSAG